MSIETGVLINKQGEPIHWHLPPGRNSGYLPDSRDLWDIIWENRDNLLGFAHSHPGAGETGPSWEDITTFSAVERGLGRRLVWWITSEDRLAVLHWKGPGQHDYSLGQIDPHLEARYPWVVELRQLSEYVRRGNPCCGNIGTHGEGGVEYCSTCGQALYRHPR